MGQRLKKVDHVFILISEVVAVAVVAVAAAGGPARDSALQVRWCWKEEQRKEGVVVGFVHPPANGLGAFEATEASGLVRQPKKEAAMPSLLLELRLLALLVWGDVQLVAVAVAVRPAHSGFVRESRGD